MTPICYCRRPDVVPSETRFTRDGVKYETTPHCRTCGHYWMPQHGSHPAPATITGETS